MADDEPKIIVDEDWKARVQREKREAAQSAQPPSSEADAAPTTPDTKEVRHGDATFLSLVQSLATQCMFALGLVGPSDAQQVMVDVEQARFLIDTLMVMRDKTKGNLTPEESGHLTEAISELQRIYVVRAQQVQEASLNQTGVNPNDLRNPPRQ